MTRNVRCGTRRSFNDASNSPLKNNDARATAAAPSSRSLASHPPSICIAIFLPLLAARSAAFYLWTQVTRKNALLPSLYRGSALPLGVGASPRKGVPAVREFDVSERRRRRQRPGGRSRRRSRASGPDVPPPFSALAGRRYTTTPVWVNEKAGCRRCYS